jgi:predicted flap endonuclease-1-like 5' DNA nuclease
MERYEKNFTNTVLVWIFGLVLGLLFGLVVLGWWLWPVQWVDSSPAELLYQYQVEYLNTAIEAYGYTGDTSVAQARYFALGDNKETALAEIVQNPGNLPPELVSEFSQQVAGVPVDTLATQPIETPKTTTGLNTWIAVLVALLFIFIGVVATYLILRGKRRQEAEEGVIAYEAAPEEEQVAEELIEVEPILSQADFEAPLVEETELPEYTRADVAEEMFSISGEEEAETGVQEVEGLDLPPFLAAAGAAAAAGFAAAELSESEAVEEETVGEAPESEFVEEQEIAFEESPLEEAGMAGMAAAWLAEEEAQPGDEGILEEAIPPVEEGAEEEIEAPEFTDFEVEEVSEAEAVVGTVEAVQEEAPEVEEVPQVEELVKPHDPIEVKMRKKLEYVEGIGPAYAQKLAEIGILTTGKLIVEGVTRAGRQELAEKTGISERLILKWLNMIDLYRIKGIGSEYADLLEAAGVDTVPELAQRNADNLYQTLANTNEEKRLVRQLPTPEQVAEWVEQAKNLPRIIQY